MSDLYTRLAIQKNLQGKELSAAVKKGVGNLAGKKLGNQEAKKVLINTLSYKSKYAREKILRKAGMDYKVRDKVEQDLFGKKQLTPSELRMQAQKQKMIIRRNIAATRMTSDLGEKKTKIGMNYISGSAKNRMTTIADRDTHGAAIKNYSSISNMARKNIGSLSVDSKANKVAGGFGVRNNSAPIIGRGGITRPIGM